MKVEVFSSLMLMMMSDEDICIVQWWRDHDVQKNRHQTEIHVRFVIALQALITRWVFVVVLVASLLFPRT